MSAFKSEKLIPISVTDLGPVAQELAEHFKQRSYQVECTQSPDGACEVGITRRNMFKAVVGLNSAMKVRLEACPQGTMVHARVGIFGKQAVPTAISMFVAWPVLFTQIWGMIREAELDNEAVRVVEVSLRRAQRLGGSSGGGPQSAPGAAAAASAASGASVVAGSGAPAPAETFCTGCGTQLETSAAFCAACGHPRTDTPQAPSHPATPEAPVSP